MERRIATYRVNIYVAGDIDDARRICRQYTMRVGFCVTVEAVEFIYTAGSETGVRVGCIHYPRFPTNEGDVWSKAKALALELMAGLFQTSVLLESSTETLWITTREEGASQ